jgi:hypothetical protein
MAAWQENI